MKRFAVTSGHGAQGDPATAEISGRLKQPAVTAPIGWPIVHMTKEQLREKYPAPKSAGTNKARLKRGKRMRKRQDSEQRIAQLLAEVAQERGAGQEISEEQRRQREADQSRLGGGNQPVQSQRRLSHEQPVRCADPRERVPLSGVKSP